MVPLSTVFFAFVILFAIVGALRGWAKELLVTFSVVLARFIEYVSLLYVPVLSVSLGSMRDSEPRAWFFLRLVIFGTIVSAGYATTALSAKLGGRARKEKLQDTLLGVFLGGINGYLITGYLWGFIDELGYKIWGITGPQSDAVRNMLKYLPRAWLEAEGQVVLFIAVAVSFAFVLIVFV